MVPAPHGEFNNSVEIKKKKKFILTLKKKKSYFASKNIR